MKIVIELKLELNWQEKTIGEPPYSEEPQKKPRVYAATRALPVYGRLSEAEGSCKSDVLRRDRCDYKAGKSIIHSTIQ